MDFNEDLKKTPSKKMTSSPRPFTRIFGTALAGNDIPLARNQKFYNDELPQRQFDPDKAKWHLKFAVGRCR